jgi:NTE family protein
MKFALALEGGGARGAYQAGVVKALNENGYEFDAVVGTSIGSINGAVIAQGDIELAYDLWKNMSFSEIFYLDDKKINSKINVDIIKYFSKKITQAIKSGGVDTSKIRAYLEKIIDEEKLRNSKTDFGLVTFNISDKKPEQLFVKSIPQGKVIDYVMASSRLPGFKNLVIDNKSYIDGGVYDNCPVNMLVEKGYKNIIAVRINKGTSGIRNYNKIIKDKTTNIDIIGPIDNLPSILSFDNVTSNELLKLGYFDAQKYINKLDGIRYYTKPQNEEYFFNRICKFDVEHAEKIAKILKLKIKSKSSYMKILFEEVIPLLVYRTQVKVANNYKEAIYALVEYVAIKENVEKYKVYDFEELLALVKNKIKNNQKAKIDDAIYRFVKSI